MANPTVIRGRAVDFGRLHVAAMEELHEARRRARDRRWRAGRIGADDDESMFTELGQAYGMYLGMAQQLASDAAHAPADYIAEQAQRVKDGMGAVADAAKETGLPLLEQAAHSVSEAMRELVGAFADNFRAFWGIPPWVFVAGGAVLVGGTILGVGYLLTSGGGQALLSGAGGALAGGGAALARAAL